MSRRAVGSRDRANMIYGRNPLREALRGRRRVRRMWTSDETRDIPSLGSDLQVSRVARDQLEELCGSPDHQGIVAEVDPFPYVDAETLLDSDQALVVGLDQVQDPQNLRSE